MKPDYKLDTNAIEQLGESLKECLANTHLLYLKTLNAHWNVEDPAFYALHEMLQKQYEELAESVDEIAERIRMMGLKAPGSMQEFLQLATLKENKPFENTQELLQTLASDHEESVQFMRKAIALAEKLHDPGTADFYTDLLRAHEKNAWFLRSHLL